MCLHIAIAAGFLVLAYWSRNHWSGRLLAVIGALVGSGLVAFCALYLLAVFALRLGYGAPAIAAFLAFLVGGPLGALAGAIASDRPGPRRFHVAAAGAGMYVGAVLLIGFAWR